MAPGRGRGIGTLAAVICNISWSAGRWRGSGMRPVIGWAAGPGLSAEGRVSLGADVGGGVFSVTCGEAAAGVSVDDGVVVDRTSGQEPALCRAAFCCGAAGHGADDAVASFGDVVASVAVDPDGDMAGFSAAFVVCAAGVEAEDAGVADAMAVALTDAITSPG